MTTTPGNPSSSSASTTSDFFLWLASLLGVLILTSPVAVAGDRFPIQSVCHPPRVEPLLEVPSLDLTLREFWWNAIQLLSSHRREWIRRRRRWWDLDWKSILITSSSSLQLLLFPLIESFPELIFDSIKYRVYRGAIGDWLCWLVSCWLVGQQKWCGEN